MAAPAGGSDVPHLPAPAPIDALGNGGFRFGGMSHRGALLCLPDGIWAWPVTRIEEVSEASLAAVLARSGDLDMFLLGTGRDQAAVAPRLRERFRAVGISLDVMTTPAAARTYNIVLAEGRRAGAGLIAVD
jgi:uncharacterized protein